MDFLTSWADSIDNRIRPVARGFNFIGVFMLVLMVLLLVIHVVGRKFFLSPLSGLPEIEEMLLVILAFFALPYTGLIKGHVRVDIIVNKFPLWLQHVIDTCTGLTSLTLWIFIALQSLKWGIMNIGELRTQYLLVPISPFVFVIVFFSIFFWFVLTTEILRSLHGAITVGGRKALWILAGIGLIVGISLVALYVDLPWSKLTVGLVGILILMILLFMRMPIGFTMAFIGLIGVWYFRGWEASYMIMGAKPYYTTAWYLLVVVPLFILMGEFCYHARISKDLYDTAYTWLGRLPGGVASATIGGCAAFAAICGDSLATAATMGTVALPELKRYKYDDSLATGALAAGGTLGILIPPSMGFIFYSLITEESTGKLFIAGIIPGIILASLFILSITIRTKLNPKLGPSGPSTTWKEKIFSLKGTWAMLVLFFLVIGGIYMGWFTVIEAGGIGAFGALIMMIIKKRFTWQRFVSALLETGRTTCMLIMIMIGVFILGFFMTTSEVPLITAQMINALEVNRYIILTLILLIYLVLGMLMNIIPMIILTLPIFYPTIVFLDFDLIWFGVVMVVMMEMGQITPPIGMNVFIIAGVAKTVPLGTIFRGIMPFWGVQVVFLIVLTIFPQIATWLPDLMWAT